MPKSSQLTPAAYILSTERIVATLASGSTVGVLASGLPVSTAQAAADTALANSIAAEIAKQGAANGVEQLMGNGLVVGDSLSARNWAVSGFGKDIFTQLSGLSNWTGRSTITNYATNSMTAQSVAFNIATWSARMKCSGGVAFVFLGKNDYGFRTSAQIFADLQTIWAACRSAGRIVVAFLTPSLGVSAVREAVKALIQAATSDYDYLIDTSDFTSADTVDNTHLTADANLVVAGRINTALGALWDEIVKPAQTWDGSSVFRRASLYASAVNIKTEPVAYALESDTNHPVSTGLEIDDVPVFPFPFPMNRGLRVGVGSLQTAALVPNTITLSGNFFIGAWVRMSSYSFGTGTADGPIIGNDGSGATGDFFGIAGAVTTDGGTPAAIVSVRPRLRINSVDYSFTELPSLRVDVPAFVACRRLGNLIYVSVNGIWSKPISNSGTITIDRLFRRSVAASIFVGDVFGIVVKSGTVSSREIQHWMRGGSASSIGGTTEAEWLFGEGAGAYPLDTSSNRRVINLSAASNWAWCFPTGRPVAGTSTDNGNAAATLTVATSYETQRWNTALTADRAVTLSTTGAAIGARFRIVRGASATGAFNLNVGTGPLKALGSASAWCEVEFDGTAWRLTASGTL